MYVGQGLFTFIFWFLYVYLIASFMFLTYNIIKRGMLDRKNNRAS